MNLLLLLGCLSKEPIKSPITPIVKPPIAERITHVHKEHNIDREDPYYWMRDRENPKVISYLEAENAYTEASTKHLSAKKRELTQEMLGRIQENDLSVPVKNKGYFYYTRTKEGKAYRIHCRKKGSMENPEEILVDENSLAEGKKYFRLGGMTASPNQKILAYTTDVDGNERYDLVIKNLETGKELNDSLTDISGRVVWGNDNQTIFYRRMDKALRPHQVWRHQIGEPTSSDVLVYEESDEQFRAGMWKSRSEKYIFIYSASSLTTEIHIIDADSPKIKPRLMSKRHPGMEYWPEHQNNRFLIVTNDCDDANGKHAKCAPNSKLMEASINSSDRKEWRELISHRNEVQLLNVEAFNDFIVIFEREAGLKHMRIQHLKSGKDKRVKMPEPAWSIWQSDNPEYNTDRYRFRYSSLVSPRKVQSFVVASEKTETLKTIPVIGYDPEQYVSKRILIKSHDGVEVPVSIVHRKDLDPDTPHPLYLYGYGAYGANMDPYFSSTRLSLVDRGVIFAMAHVRGGAEMGRQWYEDGKFLKKKNSFLDFIACAEGLIKSGQTSTEKLVIAGGSAGGLLIGATINMRPDLFLAAVAKVPFVDVVSTMLDKSIPLTAGEWEEWGDPRQKTYFDYMLSYSPYDNVKEMKYPHLLVTSGLNDPRVQYWEPTKWVARLRHKKTDKNLLLLKTNMNAGHGGNSGRYGYLRDSAFEYAFLIDLWGLK